MEVAGNYRSAVEVLTVWQVLVTFQSLPGATERLLFRAIFIFKGSVGCDRLLWGSDTGDGAPAKARVKIRIL